MHHVRIKDLNPKANQIDKIMAKKRKQIPLMRECHMNHHNKKKVNNA